MTVALGFHEVVKAFGPVEVLHGVSFTLAPGRIYGLLGENGAGKSTLMKIASGYERPTGGELRIDGRPVRFAGSRDAEDQGIVLIHQEFALADDLTVAQNIFLGHEKKRGWFLDDAAMRVDAAAVLRQVGLKVDPDRRVGRLIVAEKQLVEIAKALARNARLLIMDEPTATLTPGETERLFALMAQLKAGGATIVYISHKLDEVERITDEVIVMRDGRFVAREATAGLTRQQMANLMVGRELSDLFPPKVLPTSEKLLPLPSGERVGVRGVGALSRFAGSHPSPLPEGEGVIQRRTQPLLHVDRLSVPGWAWDVSFAVHAGEILGFAGLVGAGRTELFEGLLGLRPHDAERILIDGRPVRIANPRQAADLGLTYLSEDRKGKGLHVAFGLTENLTLMDLARYARPWLHRGEERAALKSAVAGYGIRTGSLDLRAASLSGGNQQKLALAKVLQPGPKVIVLDEPTRGVDIGAKRDIYFLIARLAAQGAAVVVISSELIELIGLCHRVAVMRGGRLQTTLAADHLTEEELIAHATGTH